MTWISCTDNRCVSIFQICHGHQDTQENHTWYLSLTFQGSFRNPATNMEITRTNIAFNPCSKHSRPIHVVQAGLFQSSIWNSTSQILCNQVIHFSIWSWPRTLWRKTGQYNNIYKFKNRCKQWGIGIAIDRIPSSFLIAVRKVLLLLPQYSRFPVSLSSKWVREVTRRVTWKRE